MLLQWGPNLYSESTSSPHTSWDGNLAIGQTESEVGGELLPSSITWASEVVGGSRFMKLLVCGQ